MKMHLYFLLIIIKSLKLIIGDKFETMKKRGNLPAELWDLFDEKPKDSGDNNRE